MNEMDTYKAVAISLPFVSVMGMIVLVLNDDGLDGVGGNGTNVSSSGSSSKEYGGRIEDATSAPAVQGTSVRPSSDVKESSASPRCNATIDLARSIAGPLPTPITCRAPVRRIISSYMLLLALFFEKAIGTAEAIPEPVTVRNPNCCAKT